MLCSLTIIITLYNSRINTEVGVLTSSGWWRRWWEIKVWYCSTVSYMCWTGALGNKTA